ncbi:GNAT family N-acetyltransferase [Stenotrophomonas indicatrix]|uniref:GNAT family N-acetyltransferase n=1 Tax=Stenotrophomonas indicatrix TaxID=2045451 RepID=UPI0013D918D6|nr:GNAT family N-acetyltransferase [Stenotrophomonas indicatrix]MCR8713307.1 GNAT family N-acetyltransferase [Stenotrophomonas indicatrix]
MHPSPATADMPAQATYPPWTDHLSDGTTIYIRPIRPSDAEKEKQFIEALSPESRRNRFLAQIAHPSEALIKQLACLDPLRAVALVGTLPIDGTHALIGIARYNVGPRPDECECAVTVLDSWQGHGVGTILMLHLMEVARARDMLSMWSLDSGSNASMSALAERLGFKHAVDTEDASQVVYRRKL